VLYSARYEYDNDDNDNDYGNDDDDDDDEDENADDGGDDDDDDDDDDVNHDDVGRGITTGATEKGAYLHALQIITHSRNRDASPDACRCRFLARSTPSTSSSSSSSLWRTTRFSSTMFTSSARLSASE